MSTPEAQGRSRPVRYELINSEGLWIGTYDAPWIAANVAKSLWPDQEQDEDRTGKGWDVQAVQP